MVTPYSIHPIIHGGAVRISNLIRQMSTFADVWLLVLGEGTDDEDHRKAYDPICERVLFHRIPEGTTAPEDPYGLMPPSPSRYSDPAISQRISALVDAHHLDVVQLEFAELGAHIRRPDGARTILVEHDIGFETQRRQRALHIADRFDAAGMVGADPLDGVRQERFELRACAAADQVHCMSARDRRILASRLAHAEHLRVIPNGVDTKLYCPGPVEQREGVLFFGSFPHLPNLDAFEHLVDEVWPEVRRRKPDATLTVAGARPPAEVLEHDGHDGIRVVGEVDEAAPLYRDHRMLLVPLRSGSGTRLKILEAMASGLPVVSTTLGAEGLELSDPPELTTADSPSAMADAVSALLDAEDREIETIGARGRALVTTRYDWTGVGRLVHTALNDILDRQPITRPLEVLATDPAAPEADPDLTVVIPTCAGRDLPAELVEALEAPAKGRSLEVVIVDHGSPEEALDRRRGNGFRVLSVSDPDADRGAVLNAGAAVARGRILVFANADAIPASSDWLELITAPFDHDRPPAAVQGGITHQLIDGIPPHDPGFTRERRRWRRDHGGLIFSLANAAMPKEVWERFPFAPGPLTDIVWQSTADLHEMLILPCHAAAVRRVHSPRVNDIFRAAVDDGRALRRFGVRPGLRDLADDLFHPLPALAADGRPAPPPPESPHRRFAVAHALGLFLGARFDGR